MTASHRNTRQFNMWCVLCKHMAEEVGVYKTWVQAHGPPHGPPYGLPYGLPPKVMKVRLYLIIIVINNNNILLSLLLLTLLLLYRDMLLLLLVLLSLLLLLMHTSGMIQRMRTMTFLRLWWGQVPWRRRTTRYIHAIRLSCNYYQNQRWATFGNQGTSLIAWRRSRSVGPKQVAP